MNVHRVRCDDIAPTPWKNGKGLVRDLLHWPNAAQWQARISVADIDVDSPFSVHEGAERWFSVVQGHGVRLRLPGGWRHVLAEGAAACFRGEDAPACELIDGPTRDLNLMVPRSAGRGEMSAARPGIAWQSSAALRALFSADAVSLHGALDAPVQLPPFTLVWTDAARAASVWHIDSATPLPRAWWLAFDPVPR
jgi:hypothetical protein